MAMNQPPRLAQAEPVAGSSRIARVIREEEAAQDLLRARRGEHIGLARAVDALEPFEQFGLRAARAAPPLRW